MDIQKKLMEMAEKFGVSIDYLMLHLLDDIEYPLPKNPV